MIAAAVLAACLVIPASRQIGPAAGMWAAAAIMWIPTMAVLAVTGFRHYGVLRSIVVAAAISIITAIVSFVVSAFTFATALSGSVTGAVVAIVLFGGPALSVVICGLLALRLVPAHHGADREHEHV